MAVQNLASLMDSGKNKGDMLQSASIAEQGSKQKGPSGPRQVGGSPKSTLVV